MGRPFREDAERALADVLGSHAGQPLVGHRQRERQHAVRPLLRAHAEMDQVVPVERGVEQGRRHLRREERVGLALGIEVRHVVLAHQHRHALAVRREERARVLEGRPDHVLHAGLRRAVGHRRRLREFLLRRKVLPEVGHAVGAVGAVHRAPHARGVVQVRRDDFGAGLGQRPAASESGLRVTARTREAAGGMREDRACEPAALGAGGAEYRDDLVGHANLLREAL